MKMKVSLGDRKGERGEGGGGGGALESSSADVIEKSEQRSGEARKES